MYLGGGQAVRAGRVPGSVERERAGRPCGPAGRLTILAHSARHAGESRAGASRRPVEWSVSNYRPEPGGSAGSRSRHPAGAIVHPFSCCQKYLLTDIEILNIVRVYEKMLNTKMSNYSTFFPFFVIEEKMLNRNFSKFDIFFVIQETSS